MLVISTILKYQQVYFFLIEKSQQVYWPALVLDLNVQNVAATALQQVLVKQSSNLFVQFIYSLFFYPFLEIGFRFASGLHIC
jgi:hypothetical protein